MKNVGFTAAFFKLLPKFSDLINFEILVMVSEKSNKNLLDDIQSLLKIIVEFNKKMDYF